VHRGDILTIVGRPQDTAAAIKFLGQADRPTDVADVAFLGGAIALGALIGAYVVKVGGAPLTLSTAGGALISGLMFGWLRSIHPTIARPAAFELDGDGASVGACQGKHNAMVRMAPFDLAIAARELLDREGARGNRLGRMQACDLRRTRRGLSHEPYCRSGWMPVRRF
jgi:hypothetical protein